MTAALPTRRDPIALIGIGCRFPGGVRGPAATWAALVDGADPVTVVPRDRWDADAWYDPDPAAPGKAITREAAFLQGVDRFDAARFGIGPSEAAAMDPQQRLVLEVAWEALEDAGLAPDRVDGARVGVYLGMGLVDWERRTFAGDPARIDAWSGTGAFSSIAAGRVAYALGLAGPAIAVHTACSSSLVALHLAVQALRDGSVDVALAGGVNLLLAPEPSVYFSKLGALSADGRCRSFDADASGYGRGEGVGFVVLRRAGEVGSGRVRALVLGSAVNQDGRSNGLTAPSGAAQQAVIRQALADAGVEPSSIGLIEAHGTGTPLGDPIEAQALAAVYGAGDAPCLLRSVKTVFGHTEAAAGVAGVIAAVLALEHGEAPPNRHFQTLNPRIDLTGTRLRIAVGSDRLVGTRAAVSAFGLAGTNAHVLLEAPPPRSRAPAAREDAAAELIVVSAGSEAALVEVAAAVAGVVVSHGTSATARSAGLGRALQPWRKAVVGANADEVAAALRDRLGARGPVTRLPPLVFAFTGQGSQWPGMGLALQASEPVFGAALAEVDALLRPLRDGSLLEAMADDRVHRTEWTQPALFAVGWALSRLWASWGVTPDALIGHSIGEVTAAAVAGVLELPDAVRLVEARGRLMGALPTGGAMAAVRAGLPAVKAALDGLPGLGIAAVNSPAETVISGDAGELGLALDRLAADGIDAVRLRVSHAFHSPAMDPILDDFQRSLEGIRFGSARVPLVSNVTGRLAGDEVRTTTYWREHIRRPVRFQQGVTALTGDGYSLFLEIGPHPALSGMGTRTAPESIWLPGLRRDAEPRRELLGSLGALITRGLRPEAAAVWADGPRVDLPLTPPGTTRYWLDAPAAGTVDTYDVAWGPATGSGPAPPTGVVHQALLDGEAAGDGLRVLLVPPGVDLDAAWEQGPERIRAAWGRARAAGERLWIVTRGAVAVAEHEAPDPGSALAWGLGRVLALEDPVAWGGLLDLPGDAADDTLADRITAGLSAGEDQVAVREEILAPRLTRRSTSTNPQPPARGTWLVTGGSGALGRAVARWLVDQGVDVVVASRRPGAPVAGARAVAVDLGDAPAVRALVDDLPDLVGVIHAAGAVSPGSVAEVDAAAFRTGFEAKVLGAATLDRATRDRPLRAFVCLGSIAAVWGSAGLGGYAACNAALEAITASRRALGLPGITLAFGPWAEGGLVDADERRRFTRMGVRPLSTDRALEALAALLGSRGTRVVADVDWATFGPVITARAPRPLLSALLPRSEGPRGAPRPDREVGEAEIAAELRAVLGLDPALPIDPKAGFFTLGLDSLTAVELHGRLRDRLGLDLPATVAFDHPTVAALTAFARGVGPERPAAQEAAEAEPIAIVGWSARFPGAPDAAAFEALLFEGRAATTNTLTGTEWFDADFFGMGPAEAAATDPQQRLLLEGTVEALEHAAFALDRLAGRPVGVFVGLGPAGYWPRAKDPATPAWPWSGVGNEPSFAAGRIAFHLGLRGPALAVSTACSSSLVAVHLAVRALRAGECEVAVAGGSNLLLDPSDTAWLAQIGALSPTGACRTFDAAADGYARSEGCAVVALQPLSKALAEGRPVLGVIRGSAVGHGGASGGLTIPNGPAEAEVIRRALDDAGVSPADVGYLECHGTGTALGDPIEVGALREVFATRDAPLVLGAAKANVGHAEAAAGLVGLIAAALVLARGHAPPSPRLNRPNPRLDLDWPVALPDRIRPVHGLAGVSSFGISGTYAHVVLGGPVAPAAVEEGPGPWLVAVSAHSEAALERQLTALEDVTAPVAAVARTLAVGRSARAVRRAALVHEGESVVARLREGIGAEHVSSSLGKLGADWMAGRVDRLDALGSGGPLVALPSVGWVRQRWWLEAETTPAVPIRELVLRPSPAPNGRRVVVGADPEEALRVVAGLASEPAGSELVVVAPGALSGSGPAPAAAAVGAVAVLRAERPDIKIELEDPGVGAPRWEVWRGEGPLPTGTWAITGAAGALGRRVATWLVGLGVTVVGCGRGADPGLPGVTWVRADVGQAVGVDALLAAAPAGGFDGVIHAAGANRSALLRALTQPDLDAVFPAKVGGALQLAARLPPRTRLVLFGSATAWLGLPGQGAYAAANAVLDGVAARRPNTTSIAWGPWQAGMAGTVDWGGTGVTPMSDDRALAALRRVIGGGPPRVAVIDLDPAGWRRARGRLALLAEEDSPANSADSSRPVMPALLDQHEGPALLVRLEQAVSDAAAAVLGHPLPPGAGLFEAGLDSLGAVELSRRLGGVLGIALPATLAFDAPDVPALAKALAARLVGATPARPTAAVAAAPADTDDPVVVVGLACRFAGADDADALWALIANGGHAIGLVPPERWDLDTWYDPDPAAPGKAYARHGGWVRGIDQFDPELFGIAPREAEGLDPQQRLLLDTAWRALDDAGWLDTADGSSTGVFVGAAERGWLRRFEAPGRPHYADAWAGTGAESSFAAGRVAHALGLRGPALALNTTCSSSLVAIHLAAAAIRRGDCDRALAGGVHLVLDPESTAYLCKLGALSPSGRCHTFDAAADGYVRGEGCGVLVLERLSEARRLGHRVRAVLRGSAVNHDGHAGGLTVPSGPAQTEVIRRALADAGLGPDGIGWLQAHGTGTPLGDPIELSAAAVAFAGRGSKLPVGTVKTAIGHCELAAGVAGAIAAILALEHQQIPPHPIDRPNPELDLGPWELLGAARPWPRSTTPRRAGVSAFGLSGTNAHVLLEEAPADEIAPATGVVGGPWLLPLAAHTEVALAAVAAHATVAPEILARGLPSRAALSLRHARVVGSKQESSGDSSQPVTPVRAGRAPRVAMLFTGQGSQWAGMHRSLLTVPVFADTFDRALAALAHADPKLARLREEMDDPSLLGRTERTQPALWAFEVACAAMWRAWGIEPVAVAGHSVGELAAVVVAGALDLEDGARLVAARGRLMGELPTGGAMLVAHAGEEAIRDLVVDGVEVTGVNDPEETALAGPVAAVDALASALAARGVAVTRLDVSHPFHTAAMDPILEELGEVAGSLRWSAPRIPLASASTGQVVRDGLGDPAWWRDQARRPVRFADAIRLLQELGCDAFVECGPHPILVRMGQRTLGRGGVWVGSARRGEPDHAVALRSLGALWERGAVVRWEAVHGRSVGGLPPYPAQPRRLWPEGDRFAAVGWTLALRWHPVAPRPVEPGPWVVLGDHADADALRVTLGAGHTVVPGARLVDLRSDGTLVQRLDRSRSLAREVRAAGGRIWWVGHDPAHPDAAAHHAWARALFAEHPELRGGLVDVSPDARVGDAAGALGHGEALVTADGPLVPRLEPVALPASDPALHGTWLVTGGLGALGRHLSRWLVDRGVRRLLLTARTEPSPGTERHAAVEALRAQGVEVKVGAFDAGDRVALAAFLDGESVVGVAHLAGATDPQPVLTADPGREAAVLAAKIDGAAALDAWTRGHPVAHFVLFGSIAAAWGSRELGAYGAANAWLGALARRRRAEGLPGVCVHWGPWEGGGMVDAARAERLERMGQRLVSVEAGLRVLSSALASSEAEIVAARVDWPNFLTLVEATGRQSRFDAVRPAPPAPRRLADPVAPEGGPLAGVGPVEPIDVLATVTRLSRQVLRWDADRPLDPEQPLMDLGFDSLMATELHGALLDHGLDVPVGRLLGGPSPAEIAIMAEAALGRVTESSPEAAAPIPGEGPPEPLFWTHLAAALVGLGLGLLGAWLAL